MNDEPEVPQQESQEVYDDHSVDNSVHHAVNLWPLALIALFAAFVILALFFMPDAKHQSAGIPVGKSYSAVGVIVYCMPTMTPLNNGDIFRVMVRTPDDTFFDTSFRRFHEPPPLGAAVGVLKYHECGKVDGQVVYCFDSFKVTHEGLPPLDNNGKRVEQKERK